MHSEDNVSQPRDQMVNPSGRSFAAFAGRGVEGRFSLSTLSALDRAPQSSSPALDDAINWVKSVVMYSTVKR